MTERDAPEESAGRAPRRRLRGYVALAAGLALLAVVAVAQFGGGGGEQRPPSASQRSPSPTPSPTPSSSPPTIRGPAPPTVEPALMLGDTDAPVTMVIFGDFRCPYCATFTAEQQPRLVRTYVDSGRLLLVWRDYPYRGEASKQAAVAARAAGRQDAFWEYHERLYADTDAWTGKREEFTAIATDLGLDEARFERDMADPRLRQAVEDDFEFGTRLGVPGTPAFLIQGEALFGAQPLEEFEKRIDAALDEETG